MEIKIDELTPEQINELAEKAKLADEYKTKNEQVEQEKARLVEEIKEERRKKQEAEDLAKSAIANKDVDPDEAKIREIIEQRLNEDKTKQIEMSRSQYEDKFKSSHPEFEPSNDVGGIKFQAFKKVLSKFNLNGLTTENEFSEVYNNAMLIMNGGIKQNQNQNINQNSFTPPTKSNGGIGSITTDITSKEEKLIQSIGWTKEKYLKLKASRPQFVEDLLSKVRD